MATHPDTNLTEGEEDDLYGGEAGRSFGGKAWDFAGRGRRPERLDA